MANGADIEIWNLERRIMRLPGNSPRAQPVKISAARTKRNRISRTCVGSLQLPVSGGFGPGRLMLCSS
jgi:hypothetical protein